MPLDISAYLRKFALAVPVVGGVGAGLASPPASWATAEPSTADRCQPKSVVPVGSENNAPTINIGFDGAGPEWSDLYESCLKEGLYCYRLCNDLVVRAQPPKFGGTGINSCELGCDADGKPVAFVGYSTAVPGRRPEGFEGEIFAGPGTSLGDWCAQAAMFEQAAIYAFAVLEQELEAHAAPYALRAAARQARRDEARHHKIMRRLAEGGGVSVPRTQAMTRPIRSLERMALENATEGCVGETYAAAQALVQARSAHHEGLRAAMAEIASDEVKHAELAWQVDEWLRDRLNQPQREHVKQAQRAAAGRLAATLALPVEPALITAAGLPVPAHATQLAAEMTRTLWS